MLDMFKNLFLGIPLYRYAISVGILLLALIINRIFHRYIVKILKKWAGKTKFRYDDLFLEAIHPPISALMITAGLYFAIRSLNLPAEPVDIPTFVDNTFKVAMSVISVWVAYRLSDLLSVIIRNVLLAGNEDIGEHFADLFKQAMRVMVVIIGGIMIIQNLGYSVGSLLAGLGIGGLAVALAAQDTLANLFGTVVMLTDKPFKIGDWIQFKNVDGDVESIGFRSTRVRTWSKSLMIIPNKIITSEIIQNWSAMPKRRVKMTIGITYDSPRDKIELLVERIRTLLRNDPDVDQDYLLVNFTDFGPSSLDIFLYYFTKSTVWAEYLKVREKINLQIMAIVEELGLSFAFPSQTIYFGNELESKQSE
jgi:MscS family membrane protein